MRKTKKEPFFNVLTRTFKKLNLDFGTINSSYVYVTSGVLNGVTFKPLGNRVQIVKTQSDWDIVHISLDVQVNHSLEVLLFKLYKFGILNCDNYYRLLKTLSNIG